MLIKGTDLTERQRQILAIIIEEYVSTARPVASEHITGHYGLNVSSATVRNEMVELEGAGLIAQPQLQANPTMTIRYGVWQHGATADLLTNERPNWTVENLLESLGARK